MDARRDDGATGTTCPHHGAELFLDDRDGTRSCVESGFKPCVTQPQPAQGDKIMAKVETETTATTLVDAKGVEIVKGCRVTTQEGLPAHVTRLAPTSGRVVIVFEDENRKPTMRAAHRVTVLKRAGKIQMVRAATSAARSKKA